MSQNTSSANKKAPRKTDEKNNKKVNTKRKSNAEKTRSEKAKSEPVPEQSTIDTLTVTAGELSRICGVTTRRLGQYAAEGTFKRVSHGRYELVSSIKAYIATLKLGQKEKTKPGKVEDYNDEVQDIDTERARHEHIKIKMSEIRLALMEGSVHKAEDVERVVTDMLARMKSKLEAIPAQIAPKLEMKKKFEIEDLLEIEILKALDELSEYNCEDYRSDDFIEIDEKEVMEAAERQGISNEGTSGKEDG